MKEIVDAIIVNKEKIEEIISQIAKMDDTDIQKINILDFMHKLSFHTENFFYNEEMFLKKYHSASYQQHIIQHRQFIDKMLYFQQQLELGAENICHELLAYITDWKTFYFSKNEELLKEYSENNQ
jgi:hemerythrin